MFCSIAPCASSSLIIQSLDSLSAVTPLGLEASTALTTELTSDALNIDDRDFSSSSVVSIIGLLSKNKQQSLLEDTVLPIAALNFDSHSVAFRLDTKPTSVS